MNIVDFNCTVAGIKCHEVAAERRHMLLLHRDQVPVIDPINSTIFFIFLKVLGHHGLLNLQK